MQGNIVTLCGMSSFVMLSESCLFKEKSEKEEQLVGKAWFQGADVKVYLEGPERHHETGSVLHQKNCLHTQWCPTQQSYTVYVTHFTHFLGQAFILQKAFKK